MEDINYWQQRKIDDQRRDWRTGEKNWVEEYWASQKHPHRKLILGSLKKFEPFETLLEVGVNCGCNLSLIQKEYPKVKLLGADVNPDALKVGIEKLLKATFFNCPILELEFIKDSSYDVVLSDAVLMYEKDVEKALWIMSKISKKGLILVEWKSRDEEEDVIYGHYARDYSKILRGLGKFKDIEEIKITEEFWPTKSWSDIGHIWTAR